MKITLTLRNNDGSVKETKVSEFNALKVGTIKKLFKIVDVDRLMKTCTTGKEVVNYLMARSVGMMPLVEEIVQQMFDLTEEQFDNEVEIDELVALMHIIIAESVHKLESTEEGLKNLLRAEK